MNQLVATLTNPHFPQQRIINPVGLESSRHVMPTGKTAILTAIYSAIVNPKNAKYHFNDEADQASVFLHFEGHPKIIWRRLPATVTYEIHWDDRPAETFVKAGKQTIWDIYPTFPLVRETNDLILNFHRESDELFPFGLSAQDLFRQFEKVMSIDDSATILSCLKKDQADLTLKRGLHNEENQTLLYKYEQVHKHVEHVKHQHVNVDVQHHLQRKLFPELQVQGIAVDESRKNSSIDLDPSGILDLSLLDDRVRESASPVGGSEAFPVLSEDLPRVSGLGLPVQNGGSLDSLQNSLSQGEETPERSDVYLRASLSKLGPADGPALPEGEGTAAENGQTSPFDGNLRDQIKKLLEAYVQKSLTLERDSANLNSLYPVREQGSLKLQQACASSAACSKGLKRSCSAAERRSGTEEGHYPTLHPFAPPRGAEALNSHYERLPKESILRESFCHRLRCSRSPCERHSALKVFATCLDSSPPPRGAEAFLRLFEASTPIAAHSGAEAPSCPARRSEHQRDLEWSTGLRNHAEREGLSRRHYETCRTRISLAPNRVRDLERVPTESCLLRRQ